MFYTGHLHGRINNGKVSKYCVIKQGGVSFCFFNTTTLHTDASLEIKSTYIHCKQGKTTTATTS